MSWITRSSIRHPYRSLFSVFLLWKASLLLLAILTPGPGYDTSTTLFPWHKNTNQTEKIIPSTLRRISIKLTRWDSIYFTEAARRGHLLEQEWAFSYAFSRFINLLASGRRLSYTPLANPLCSNILDRLYKHWGYPL